MSTYRTCAHISGLVNVSSHLTNHSYELFPSIDMPFPVRNSIQPDVGISPTKRASKAIYRMM